MKRISPPSSYTDSKDLLLLLGEELKQPLVAIAQLAELQAEKGSEVRAYATQALNTIDNILLYQRVHSGQTELLLEPVHIGSTMQEVAHNMEPLMRASGCHTELVIQHGLTPVDADRRLLSSALQSLWQAFLGTVQNSSEITCKAQKTPQGVRISLQCGDSSADSILFTQSNFSSAQPITGIAGPAADLLTARGMFALLGADLTKTTSKNMFGLGATLSISKQLQIV